MVSIKEEAMNPELTTAKNISELEVFDINMELHTFEGENSDGEKFKYKYVEDKNGLKYRVPYIVLSQIKEYLEEDENHTLFKVKRSGEGLKTKYTVMPVLKQ